MENFNLDFDRSGRLGFPEVIYGASKPSTTLIHILDAYIKRGQNALVTKLQQDKADVLTQKYSGAFYDSASGIFLLNRAEDLVEEQSVGIISAGTADQFVVNEAFYTLEYLGVRATCIQDIGVAGLHRLLNRLEDLKKFKILLVVAGFEGALPTVIGGLLPQPIIAVPTSVGYGVSEGGKAALSTMLASCANGITVVNIDNGYGAALAAFRLLRLA